MPFDKKAFTKNKWLWIGGAGVVAVGGYLYYKKKKESEGKTATPAYTEGEQLQQQGFIPVVSNLPGAGAVNLPGTGSGENLPLLMQIFSENEKANAEANETANKARSELEQTLIKYMQEQSTTNQDAFLKEVEKLGSGGAPGTTTGNTSGGSPSQTIVGTVKKALSGGRELVSSESGSFILSANGRNCPNTEWNRGHPHHMRGCS